MPENNRIRRADALTQFAGELLLLLEEGLSLLYPRRARKSLSDSNYEYNVRRDIRNRMITDQDGDSTEGVNGMRLGKTLAGPCGCEVIAVNNALVYLGRECSFAELEHMFEISGALTKVPFVPIGAYGANPYAIGRMLRAAGVEYSRASADQLTTESGAYIFSYWNHGGLLSGLHTVFAVNDGHRITIYNYGTYGTAQIGAGEWKRRFKGRFITAFRVTGSRC